MKRKKLGNKLDESQLKSIFSAHLDAKSEKQIDLLHQYIEEIKLSEKNQKSIKITEFDESYLITIYGYPYECDKCIDIEFASYSDLPSIFNMEFGQLILMDELPDIDVSFYLQERNISVDGILCNALLRWFEDCWIKAGGWFFPLPIKLSGNYEGHYDDDIRMTKLYVDI